MGDIFRHSGINIGGIDSVSWIFKEDIQGLTLSDTTLYCTVILKTGKLWNSLYGSPETMLVETEHQDTPSGMKYLYKLKVLVPKDRPQVELELFRMIGCHLMVKVTDKNGTIRILGTMECPMKMTVKLLKPSAIEAFNGYELLFSGEFAKPAPFIPSFGGGLPDDLMQNG